MTNIRTYAAVGLVVLALSGCAGTVTEPSAERVAPSETATSAPTGPIVLTPSTDAPASEPANSGLIPNGEAVFSEAMRENLHGISEITDAELLAAGYYACELVAAGESPDDVVIFDATAAGEPVPGWNNAALAGFATQTLCVEFDQTG